MLLFLHHLLDTCKNCLILCVCLFYLCIFLIYVTYIWFLQHILYFCKINFISATYNWSLLYYFDVCIMQFTSVAVIWFLLDFCIILLVFFSFLQNLLLCWKLYSLISTFIIGYIWDILKTSTVLLSQKSIKVNVHVCVWPQMYIHFRCHTFHILQFTNPFKHKLSMWL